MAGSTSTKTKKPAAKKTAAKKSTAKKSTAKPRSRTKKSPAAKKRSAGHPVVVTQFTRRSGDDALPGSWVDVVSGEHQGRRGSYVQDETYNPQSGYPERVVVRTRDAENELLVVNYEDLRPSAYTGGR